MMGQFLNITSATRQPGKRKHPMLCELPFAVSVNDLNNLQRIAEAASDRHRVVVDTIATARALGTWSYVACGANVHDITDLVGEQLVVTWGESKTTYLCDCPSSSPPCYKSDDDRDKSVKMQIESW